MGSMAIVNYQRAFYDRFKYLEVKIYILKGEFTFFDLVILFSSPTWGTNILNSEAPGTSFDDFEYSDRVPVMVKKRELSL